MRNSAPSWSCRSFVILICLAVASVLRPSESLAETNCPAECQQCRAKGGAWISGKGDEGFCLLPLPADKNTLNPTPLPEDPPLWIPDWLDPGGD